MKSKIREITKMKIEYTITQTILNTFSKFFELHGRLYGALGWIDQDIVKSIRERNITICSLAAVTNDKSILTLDNFNEKNAEKTLDKAVMRRFEDYKSMLVDINKYFAESRFVTLSEIKEAHEHIHGSKVPFRSDDRVLPLEIRENEVVKSLSYEVKTHPADIPTKLTEFLGWFENNLDIVNIILLVAIAHFKIAEIHPYKDGNGRLAKILTRALLAQNGIDTKTLLPIEIFFLQNQEFYFELIDKSIQESDLTKWLEFFAGGMLESINSVIDDVKKYSGGTIDLRNAKIIDLNVNEIKIIKTIQKLKVTNGVEIAKKLGVSRQYVNVIIKSLINKGLVEKQGERSGARYQIINGK